MSTLESMRSALLPVGIYNITENSNAYKELLVYSRELDRLYVRADEILREGFFATAESWGPCEVPTALGILLPRV